jgi:KipI family sensor histidine kinase inhibitor
VTFDEVAFAPLGDAALLVRFASGQESYARAAALADSLADERPAGVMDSAAAYETVAVYFDGQVHTHFGIAAIVRQRLQLLRASPRNVPDPITIPVSYDGPDLGEVCERLGITPESFIELHAGTEYTAHAVGFVPGFAYLGELDERLRLPRRATPRVRVPAGSVAIAAANTAVYPFATPGGWHLVGSTRSTMFDAARERPALIGVGARVRFVPR